MTKKKITKPKASARARPAAGRTGTESLRAVLDAAPAFIWIAHDREARHITGNRAAQELMRVGARAEMSKTGPKPERLAHFRMVKDGVELTGAELPVQRVAASGQALKDYSFDIVFDDGGARSLFGNVVPLLDAKGRPAGCVAAFVDVTERKRAAEQTRASLREKEMLLKDVHHRVKNNLQVISSLVSLQADGVNDPKMRRLFGDVRDRVRTMALVHERLYQSGSLAEVDFAEYAKSLLRALWRSHGSISENVRLRLELDPLKLSAEPATLCGLILTELASNALKHAFNDRADGVLTVRVEHNKTTGTACLRVRDDGPGLPAGLDWRKAQSLGLQLVQMLTGQMRGAVEMSDGAGVEFRVTFSTREQGAP